MERKFAGLGKRKCIGPRAAYPWISPRRASGLVKVLSVPRRNPSSQVRLRVAITHFWMSKWTFPDRLSIGDATSARLEAHLIM